MKDKVILITGATSGIGRISAERFAEKGLTVLVHGRSKDKVTKTVSEINKNTGNKKIFGYVADLSILSEVKNLAQKIKDDYQSLDILINNAGLGPVHDSIFEVNYIATVVLSLGLEPILGQDSRVVNIASEAQSPVDLENFMKASGLRSMIAAAKRSYIKPSLSTCTKCSIEDLCMWPIISATEVLLPTKIVFFGSTLPGFSSVTSTTSMPLNNGFKAGDFKCSNSLAYLSRSFIDLYSREHLQESEGVRLKVTRLDSSWRSSSTVTRHTSR